MVIARTMSGVESTKILHEAHKTVLVLSMGIGKHIFLAVLILILGSDMVSDDSDKD